MGAGIYTLSAWGRKSKESAEKNHQKLTKSVSAGAAKATGKKRSQVKDPEAAACCTGPAVGCRCSVRR